MAAFAELFGGSLVGEGMAKVSTAERLSGKKAVALYFSAHWCPPCRGFTPQLAEWYKKDLSAKGLEVVFVSSDQDEEAFKEYFGEQPWLALPFEDRGKKEALSKKFKVNGIPSLVILDENGATITKDGRAAISEDPTGEELPWKPTLPWELLAQAKLLSAAGEKTVQEAMEGKTALALYFSAHWCPPCRGFTPQLKESYEKNLSSKGLEVIFVSSDRDEESFKEYFGEMPWLALDFADRKLKNKLSSAFGVSGIPALIILDSELDLITKEGRGAISSDPEGHELPWYPKPVKNLKAGPGDINEIATVLVFCETSDADEQKAIEAALTPVAQKYLDMAKALGDDPQFHVMIVTEGTGLAHRIRGMLGLPSLPPSAHEHPLEKNDRGTGWNCDGCGQSGHGKERYHCVQGCDFDFCGDCHAKAGSKAEKLAPQLALIDIPSDGAYYLANQGAPITTASVETFLADFSAGKLERKQMS